MTGNSQSDNSIRKLLFNENKLTRDKLQNYFALTDRWTAYSSQSKHTDYWKCLAKYKLLVIFKGYKSYC